MTATVVTVTEPGPDRPSPLSCTPYTFGTLPGTPGVLQWTRRVRHLFGSIRSPGIRSPSEVERLGLEESQEILYLSSSMTNRYTDLIPDWVPSISHFHSERGREGKWEGQEMGGRGEREGSEGGVGGTGGGREG